MDIAETLVSGSVNSRVAILRLIRQSGTISRVQLAQRLGLSKSTVTENMTAFLQMGLVQETGMDATGNTGRRPIILRINGGYSHIVAVELGLHEPLFALANLNGDILARAQCPMPGDAPYAQRRALVVGTIRQLMGEAGITADAVGAIALSSPGSFSRSQQRFVLNPEFAEWNVPALVTDLENAFGTEVFRTHDMNAATYGEQYQGAAQGADHFLYVSCGLGIGVGMVLEGRLHIGASGSAGEISRQAVPPCNQPLYQQVEWDYLLEQIRADAPPETLAAAGMPAEALDFAAVVGLWQAGDAYIREHIGRMARVLGATTAMLLSLLNCELVVFGGDYLVFEEQVLPILNEELQMRAFDPVRVVASGLRENAGLKGLLSMAADVLLERFTEEMK